MRLDDVTILVVDDERDSREMIATVLEQQGAVVLQTDSAESALETLHIAMPKIDGYELIRRVRASGSRIASIAVTAFARSDDRQTALESGFSTYLAKPIDARQLARTVRDLVHVETMA